MRVLVFFDLPMTTVHNLKVYRTFRKFLLSNGFVMLQESIYFKVAVNQSMVKQTIDRVKRNRPDAGFVIALTLTEAQFARMEFITGKFVSDVLTDTSELVII